MLVFFRLTKNVQYFWIVPDLLWPKKLRLPDMELCGRGVNWLEYSWIQSLKCPGRNHKTWTQSTAAWTRLRYACPALQIECCTWKRRANEWVLWRGKIARILLIRPVWMLLSRVAVRHKNGDLYTKLSLGKNIWLIEVAWPSESAYLNIGRWR